MRCPFCGRVSSSVLDSREADSGAAIRRRRECESCHKRFTTYERVKDSNVWVIKKDGRREPFDKEKIRRGILRAIEKRPVSLAEVDEIVNEVTSEINKKEKGEVRSRTIGSAVLRRLMKKDKVAWLRYASVYLEFEDLSDFEKAIEKVN